MSIEESSKKRKLDEATGVLVKAKEYIDLEAEESDDDYESDDLGSLDYDDDESDSMDESDEDVTTQPEIISHEFSKEDVYILEVTEDITFEQLKKLVLEQVPTDKRRYGLYTIRYK